MAAGVLAVFDTLIIEDNLSFGKAAVREVQPGGRQVRTGILLRARGSFYQEDSYE